MEGTGGAEGEEIEAQIRKQNAQAKKQRHNASCRRSRLKKKTMHMERDQEFLKLQADHKRIKMEQEHQAKTVMEYHGKLQSLEDDNQILRANHHNMKEALEWTRQIAVELMNFHGHNFASFDQAVEWFALQNYAGGGQVSRASGTGLQNVNGLVGSVPVPTINCQPSMVDFDQQMCYDQDNTNIATFTAVGPAYTANHASSSASVWINSAAGSSSGASHNFGEYGAMNNHNNLCNRDLAVGVPTVTDSLPAANPTLVFGSTNNHEKDDDFSSFLEALLES